MIMKHAYALLLLLGFVHIQAKENDPPNIILIIADDQCYTDFGFMGNESVHTPHLDQLAQNGIVFENGYLPSSVCRPSLVTLLTGQYPHEHGVHFNHGPPGNSGYSRLRSSNEYKRVRSQEFGLIEQAPSLPRLLQKTGYRSLQTGKFWEGHFRNAGFTHGMTTFEAPPESQTFGGVRTLANGERVAHGNGDVGLQIGRKSMDPIFDFIGEAEKADSSWFVWYAPYLPHQPHDSPQRFYDLAATRPGVEDHELPYFASIAEFDATVGALMEKLESQGLLDTTVIIFASDNGWSPSTTREKKRPEEFKKNDRSKRAPFDEGVRSPFLIHWPARLSAERHSNLVSSVDIVPTILNLANVEAPAAISGQSWLPQILNGEEPKTERAVFGEIYPGDASDLGDPRKDLAYRFVRKGAFKLILPEGKTPWQRYVLKPVLFNVETDPGETVDLIDTPEGKAIAAELKQLILHWWRP